MLALIEQVRDYRVVLVGDTIIDEYQYVRPMGKAAKENIIASLSTGSEIFAGGVIAAANHVASFCREVEVVTALGTLDSHEELVRKSLMPNVKLTAVERPDAPTTRKCRFVDPSYTRKLFEVYFHNEAPFDAATEAKVASTVAAAAATADVVIASDFGHGLISRPIVSVLAESAPFLAVNAQTNAGNQGFNLITKYQRPHYVCLDAPEARLAMTDKNSDIMEIAQNTLPARLDCRKIMITHGQHGCVAFDARVRAGAAHPGAHQHDRRYGRRGRRLPRGHGAAGARGRPHRPYRFHRQRGRRHQGRHRRPPPLGREGAAAEVPHRRLEIVRESKHWSQPTTRKSGTCWSPAAPAMWAACWFRSCWRKATTSPSSTCSCTVRTCSATTASIRGCARSRATCAIPAAVRNALWGCDAVIHLACISNDPSFELDPELGKSINYDTFRPLVRAAKAAGVTRFIYASSSSVYGIKDEPEVTEELSLEPLTDYSKFKALCETVLQEERAPGFVTCILRPATVCGYAPRQRLDVVVNILTNQAVNVRRIKVFGGTQKRPNIHIEDMADLYVFLLQQPDDKIDGEIFNAGFENHTLMQLADMISHQVGNDITVDVVPTNDLRSYHVSSEKMRSKLGFEPKHSIEEAVRGLVAAFREGKLPELARGFAVFQHQAHARAQSEIELEHVAVD